MGNTSIRERNYSLNVDEDLENEIQKEIKVKKSKKVIIKNNKLIKKKISNLKKANFNKKFNKNEKGIKNISDLLNLIYDTNLNNKYNKSSNNTIYERIFDIRDIAENENSDNSNLLFYNSNINRKSEENE